MITYAQLQQFAPRAQGEVLKAWAPALDDACLKYGINTNRRARHFMANVGVETAGLTRFTENLNYSAEGLVRTWPKHFPTLEFAKGFEHQPEKIANQAYGGRMGNTALGDGWKYRGRDPLNRTGKNGYIQAAKITGVDCVANPDLLLSPYVGAADAAAFWQMNGCNEIADADPDEKTYADFLSGILKNEDDDLMAETLKVNGGLNGLDLRFQWLTQAAKFWA